MTIKQVFVEDGVDRPHPPKKVIDAFKAGMQIGAYSQDYARHGYTDEDANHEFYVWWEDYA